MNERVLYCEVCGNLVKEENGQCCGVPMKEISANTTEAATEKHIPVIDINGNEVTISVGEIPHPMMDEHYIAGIYLETNKEIKHKRLAPNDEPKTAFNIDNNEEIKAAYSYCNLHSLWKKEL